jgi:hypothetical protein
MSRPRNQPSQTTMIRDWYSVRSLPQETLDVIAAKGGDMRVRFAVLQFEYWRAHSSPYHTRFEMLKVLRASIDATNIDAFIEALAQRGKADEFFDLLAVDPRRELRLYLQSNGVFMSTARQYATFGLSPERIFAGFAVGLFDSFSAIVKDLPEMAKLLAKAAKEWGMLFLLAQVNPVAYQAQLRSYIASVMLIWESFSEHFEPSAIPAKIWSTFESWQTQFGKHLENLEPFEAGRLLGRVAGDLWQLFTGIVGLYKLLGVTAKLAAKFASLLLTAARELAKATAAASILLVQFLASVGAQVLGRLSRVGMATLAILFPPDILQRVLRQGAAIVNYVGGYQLCVVPAHAFATAVPGGALGGRFAVMVAHEGRPLAMATVAAEDLRPAQVLAEAKPSTTASPGKVGVFSPVAAASEQEIDDMLTASLRAGLKDGRPVVKPSELAVLIARQEQLAQRLLPRLENFIRAKAIQVLRDQLARKAFRGARDLGTEIDVAAELELQALLNGFAPGVKAITGRGKTMRTALEEMIALDKRLAPLAGTGQAVLGETVLDFLKRRADLRQALGIPSDRERDIVAFFDRLERSGWGYTKKTQLGDLKCDALLVDSELSRVDSLDWSSSTKFKKFEKRWGELADLIGDDLGVNVPKNPSVEDLSSFDWAALAEKYKAMYGKGKGLTPEKAKALKETMEDLQELQGHALRERVLRAAILQEVFAPLKYSWYVDAREVLYEGVNELFAIMAGKK